MITLLSAIYLIALAGLAIFGLLGFVTLYYHWRHRRDSFRLPAVLDHQLPYVTIQLPIYNERFVVERLLTAVANIDYPKDRLHIQVLDDSTDDTTQIAAELVKQYELQGFYIELLHRRSRIGFKAGALEAGLQAAKGEFIAVFDADFRPQPDFLRKTIPYLLNDPTLGMVQTRWGHLNPFDSQLTAAQTIALDKHFSMEQTVRHRADLYPKFNGSGGIWRRDCLFKAGGWNDDTVCEDLCLSTRAILRGWRFLFLNDVVSPAELPTSITAYKNQQSRWAKGSTQCLIKYSSSILADSKHSLLARLYALLSMAGYMTHFWLIILLLVQVPLIYLGYKPPSLVLVCGIAGLAQPILFVLGQKTLYRDWWQRLRFVPALLLIAIGLAPSNTKAIIEAIIGQPHNFVRTPKGTHLQQEDMEKNLLKKGLYHLPMDWITAIELILALYALLGVILCFALASYGPLLFMLSCTFGFGFVAFVSAREQFSFHSLGRRYPLGQPS